MNPWLTVVGINCDTLKVSSPSAIDAIRAAQLIVGSSRQLGLIHGQVDGITASSQTYPSPFSGLAALLGEYRGRPVVLLASGDPLFYGVGDFLLRLLQPGEMRFLPAISSIQAAFARIGRVWSEARIISVHGRPITEFTDDLKAGKLYGIMTDATNTPQRLARELVAHGFETAELWVMEDLGSEAEKVRSFSAVALQTDSSIFSALNVVIVQTAGVDIPVFPGIDDSRFATGLGQGAGLLTKKEVRLNILAMLEPGSDEIGWDIGSGCGGVCIEWALWARRARVMAIEKDSERVEMLKANCRTFGVQGAVEVVSGWAPDILDSLPDPQVVFVGGSGGDLTAILEAVWKRLPVNGRLVVSAVTEESRSALFAFEKSVLANVQFTEISVRRGEELQGRRILRPLFPVLLVQFRKSS